MIDVVRVGILTFHNANNYGAVLQAYALQESLKSISEKVVVEVIDYYSDGVVKQRSICKMAKSQGILSALVHYPFLKRRVRHIDDFCNMHLNLSPKARDHRALTAIEKQYDIIISGSDQIWNKKWNGNDSAFLQSFHTNNQKKVSYAASFGIDHLPESWISEYHDYLCQFRHLSVRETSGKRILCEMGLASAVHVDPTLLLEVSRWDTICKKPSMKVDYALVFLVPFDRELLLDAYDIAEKRNLKLVVVSKSLKKVKGKNAGFSSVEEIVGLFKYSKVIITNSFHGTALSMIFRKDLLVKLSNPRGYNIRAKNLLALCGVIDCNNENDETIMISASSWNNNREKLDHSIHASKEYLMNVIAECFKSKEA